MFLFKNTQSRIKRLGMNLAVYGYAGMLVLVLASALVPENIAAYVPILSGIFGFAAVLGSLLAVVGFFIELFTPVKSGTPRPAPKLIPCTLCGDKHSSTKYFRDRPYCPSCHSYYDRNYRIEDGKLINKFSNLPLLNEVVLFAQPLSNCRGDTEPTEFIINQFADKVQIIWGVGWCGGVSHADGAQGTENLVADYFETKTQEEFVAWLSETNWGKEFVTWLDLAHNEKLAALFTKDTFTCSRCQKTLPVKYRHMQDVCADCFTEADRSAKAAKEDATILPLLHHEENRYERLTIDLHIHKNGEMAIVDTCWWPAHRGASNAGQKTTPLDKDYFANHTVDEFIAYLTEHYPIAAYYKRDFSHLSSQQDVLALFPAEPAAIKVGEAYDGGVTETSLMLQKVQEEYRLREVAYNYNAGQKTTLSTTTLTDTTPANSTYEAFVAYLAETYPAYEIHRYTAQNDALQRLFLDEAIRQLTDFLHHHHYDVDRKPKTTTVFKQCKDPWNHFNAFLAKEDGLYNYVEVRMGSYHLQKRVACSDLTVATFLTLAEIAGRFIPAEPDELAKAARDTIRAHRGYALAHASDHNLGQYILDSVQNI